MNNIEEYQNLVEYLKNILSFYGNQNNYVGQMGDGSMIDFDNQGELARSALVKIREIEKTYDNINDEYKNFINAIKNEDNIDENVIKIIENLNKLK